MKGGVVSASPQKGLRAVYPSVHHVRWNHWSDFAGFLPHAPVVIVMPIDQEQERAQFLRSMYDQLWGNINRHITSLWQAIGIFLGAFAILALVEKSTVPLGMAVSLLVLGAGLLIAHCYDSSSWYNRNLHLIANVERQFLDPKKDGKAIHPYFTFPADPSKTPRMITYFKIQLFFSWLLVGLVLFWYSVEREIWTAAGRLPSAPVKDVITAVMPYVVAIIVFVWTNRVKRDSIGRYQKLVTDAPGEFPPK